MKILYERTGYPVLQNRVYDSQAEAVNCPKGDIRLVEDGNTGLVYNAAFNPDLISYDGNYQNEQGFSESFRRHLDRVVCIIGQHFGGQRLVEIGCGKGFFLELLLEQGFDVTGFDEAYEGSNPRVRRQYYRPGLVDSPQGFILRHVLEHIKDPYEFLRCLRETNGGRGRVYIEVPCFDWICKQKAWMTSFMNMRIIFALPTFDVCLAKS